MTLTPTIVQDARSGRVLMLAYSNEESLELTRSTGLVHFWSRSRQQMWRKGETSGNVLNVVDISGDCDGDALLIRANPDGPTCHTGAESCFGVDDPPVAALSVLAETIADRARTRPAGSYTTNLLDGGTDLVARKVLEEAGEVAFAAKDAAAGTGSADRITEEAADLVYHLLVLLEERGLSLADVAAALERRSN
jgi:phosphoribosyl-ATP pyrophosphohydrolase/phosphoribosyl-AMP cyclohydrolase